MNTPIIIFNPEGLNTDQVKLIKQALDDAYRAGYETAKEFYQLKFNTTTTTSPSTGITWTQPPYTINNCECKIN
jgi:23S rRNA G2445 N2-methylase RlmL